MKKSFLFVTLLLTAAGCSSSQNSMAAPVSPSPTTQSMRDNSAARGGTNGANSDRQSKPICNEIKTYKTAVWGGPSNDASKITVFERHDGYDWAMIYDLSKCAFDYDITFISTEHPKLVEI